MKGKKKHPKLKTQERPRHELQTFKVRCSRETAFYMFVDAHDAAEAEIVAENFCRQSDKEQDDGRFWNSEVAFTHETFEAEEAD
jgi:hypothetical protein